MEDAMPPNPANDPRQVELFPSSPVRVEECFRCGFLRPVRALWRMGFFTFSDEPRPVCGPCARELVPEIEARGGFVSPGVPRGGLL